MSSFSFCVVNLGCKVNRVESDGFARLLVERGGVPSGESEADIIVVNSCTVTGEAEKKTRKAVRHALAANAHAALVVTGCATEIDRATYEAMDERVAVVPKAEAALYLASFVDGLTAIDRKGKGALTENGSGGAFQTKTFPNRSQGDGGGMSLPIDGRTRVGIKVQDGCDNACTYCIVHVARGHAVSRPADEVVAEAVALARAGVREIVLTGINLGSYNADGIHLADLCRRLLSETGHIHGQGELPCRFRIGSVEPMDLSKEFIHLLAQADGRICRHLHLPLQSGSSKVLREMARPYDGKEFLKLVDTLRATVSGIALTTDIIVGFPGETEEDFENTCDMARRCGFSKIHVFPYSRREGTPAAARTDQVSSEIKAVRAAQLRALSDELGAADRAARQGTVELALVESPQRATTESYWDVTPPKDALVGSLIPVIIGDWFPHPPNLPSRIPCREV